MFYERLKMTCIKNNTNITNVLKKLNLPTSNTGSWKKGMLPKSDTLKSLATELNVSTDYLLGLTDKPQNTETEIKGEEEMIMISEEKLTAMLEKAAEKAVEKYVESKNDRKDA